MTYHGELQPDAVVTTFARYDAFAFPTLGENFGHVIAESLSAGCAVICSDQTPWTPVLLAGGGTVVDAARSAVDRRRRSPSGRRRRIAQRDCARPVVRAVYEEWLTDHDADNVIELVLRGIPARSLAAATEQA